MTLSRLGRRPCSSYPLSAGQASDPAHKKRVLICNHFDPAPESPNRSVPPHAPLDFPSLPSAQAFVSAIAAPPSNDRVFARTATAPPIGADPAYPLLQHILPHIFPHILPWCTSRAPSEDYHARFPAGLATVSAAARSVLAQLFPPGPEKNPDAAGIALQTHSLRQADPSRIGGWSPAGGNGCFPDRPLHKRPKICLPSPPARPARQRGQSVS